MSTREQIQGLEAVLERLSAAGVVLFVQGGKLRARPQNALTEELRALLAAHREELRDFVCTRDGPQNPQNAQNSEEQEKPAVRDGPQNAQNAQKVTDEAAEAETRVRLKGVYGLLKEALAAGYLGPAQQVGADVVSAVEQVAQQGEDVARACRLLSRDGAGNDVAAAALLSAYEELCRRLACHGTDTLRRRAAVALLVARATETSAEPVVPPDGRRARKRR